MDATALDLRDFGHFSAAHRRPNYREYFGYAEVPVNAELIALLALAIWNFGTTPAQTNT